MDNNHVAVQRALATIRQQAAARSVEMARLCSKHGLPYTAVYKEVNGLWRFESSMRAVQRATGQSRDRSLEISGNQFDPEIQEICPWCGCGAKNLAGSRTLFARCARCHMDVCLYRSSGNTFRCSVQCGSTGEFADDVGTFSANLKDSVPVARLTSGARTVTRLMLGSGGGHR